MADQKIKVTIKWGDKDTKATIKIKAKTLGGALEALEKRDEWGKFNGPINYKYEADADDIVTEVTLKPSYLIEMPTWDGYKKAPKACQKEWDRMYKELEKHEEGHRVIHLETLTLISNWLEEAVDLSVDTFKSEFDDWIAKGQANQDKYDDNTDHGAKKGVELTITEECE